MAEIEGGVGEDGTRKYSRDKEVEAEIARHVDRFNRGVSDLINDFPVYARRITIKRFLAHYELFRQTINLPGDIVELGVFRGHSLLTWANFLEARNIGDRTKKVWGFDNFKGFGKLSPEDGPEYSHMQKTEGGFSPGDVFEELSDLIRIFDSDRFVPWKKRIELVVGDVEETVPKFLEDHPGLRISLLHFDVDLYKPTLVGLQNLFPLVVPGGVVVFDEYGVLEWGGESLAVEEYLRGQNYTISKFDWNNIPGGYLVK
jgi:hypothetical protein